MARDRYLCVRNEMFLRDSWFDSERKDVQEAYGWDYCDSNGVFDQIEVNRVYELRRILIHGLNRHWINQDQYYDLAEEFCFTA